MPPGVRQLTVLGKFKPFGLIAEATDGKSPDENSADSYQYLLFDPELTGERDDAGGNESNFSRQREHELFIRDNRIIWTSGSRVLKRFTLSSAIIKACWSHLGRGTEAFLCVLQIGCLTIYNTSGEVVSVPLPRTVKSIWPLPFGLLLQQAAEVNPSSHVPFSSVSPIIGSREMLRQRKEVGNTSPQNFHSPVVHDLISKRDMPYMSSHLILRDPLEEPGPIYVEERGKINIMKEYDERTIWTSDRLPLMTSYNKGKMQHSVWTTEFIESNLEASASCSSGAVSDAVFPKRVSFRRIWQAKGAKKAASKVFLATDDAVPVICFLILEQKKLLLVGLQTVEINNEILFDVKPDLSWSVSAIAAAPVVVTRSQVKIGLLPHLDIIVLSPENELFLYSGKQCLCRYVLPSWLGESIGSGDQESAKTDSGFRNLKITGLSDAVLGCINLSVNHSQIFRCALTGKPSSLLANDCIAAIAEGLRSDLYNLFLSLLWGDGHSDQQDSSIHFEWEALCNIFLGICQKPTAVHLKQPTTLSEPSWEFLLSSKFHKTYSRFHSGITSINPLDLEGIVPFDSKIGSEEIPGSSFELMVQSLDCLHAVYESLKMDNLRKQDLHHLAVLLCNIAKFLDEKCYLDHYIRDFPRLSKSMGTCTTLSSSRKPPNLFRWLENCLRRGCLSTTLDDLPELIRRDGCSIVSWARKVVSFYSVLFGDKPEGRTLSSGVPCNIASGSYSSNEELTILAMAGERFGLHQLDLLPSGVSLPLRHALDSCRESPPADWPAIAYVLLGREDMALSVFRNLSSSKEFEMQSNTSLISMSIPYMLHLHPVIVPSSLSESIGLENTKIEDTNSVDGSVIDGMEHIFNSFTQLRYGRDLRLNEVRRLLCSARPVVIQTSANPTISDQEQQQDQLWRIAQRTAVLPLGRGAFTLSTIHTLLTEAFTVPKLVLAGRLPAQQNAIVNLDPNVRNIQELKTWPEFHNAVAAGLRLAPLQGKVSRTWIKYNKPGEPNAVHAGLLFGLGLQGYLHVLNLSDIYQYFTQDHESTTVGLMLGLAASYRRTMQPDIAKALFFHVPARYQASYAEFEIPTLLQSAALVSVGMLFEGSAHLQTMQLLLGEIGRRSAGDNVLEREGYAVSAGFSLGLVALGRGGDALGSMDSFVNRLLQYLGAKEERSILAPSNEDHRSAAQITDGSTSNVDITAPGAIIALTLMYLKTESEVIFSKLSIPQTHYDLECVRPDFIMLRVIARNLIMWSRISPTCDWIQSQVPEVVKNSISHLRDDMDDMYEVDVEALVQAYVNIVAGACISLGLRFAGTRDGNARDLLNNYALCLLNEIKPLSATPGNAFPRGISKYVDRGTLEMCLYLIIISLSVIMAGSGDLQVFRLLRFLRSRNSADGHANYGTQMAVSLATGFLFLGGGMRTFSTNNGSLAMLLITLYPRLPSGPNDNRCHLQAFRHLYVLATEARWLQTIDVDSGLPVYAPLEVTVKETKLYSETRFCEVTPCILPERAILKRICVCGPRYWPQQIELVPEEKNWWSFGDKSDPFNSGVIYVKRKVGACSYVDDPVGCQSLLSRAMHKVFGLRSLGESNMIANSHRELDSDSVDHLVSTFSSDPSLIAFAQLCCDKSWNNKGKCVGRADLTLSGSFADMVLSPIASSRQSGNFLFMLTNPGQLQAYDDTSLASLMSQKENKISVYPLPYPMVVPTMDPHMTVAMFAALDVNDETSLALSEIVLAAKARTPRTPSRESAQWPLTGGVPSHLDDYKLERLYMAGYQDGSMRIWGATYPCLSLIYVLEPKANVIDIAGVDASVTAFCFYSKTSNLAVGNECGMVRLFKLVGHKSGGNLEVVTNTDKKAHHLHREDGPQWLAAYSFLSSPVCTLRFVQSTRRLAVGFKCGKVGLNICLSVGILPLSRVESKQIKVPTVTFKPALICYDNSGTPNEKPAENPSGKHENKSHINITNASESHSPDGEQTAVTETKLVQRFANSLFLMCSEDALRLYSLKSFSQGSLESIMEVNLPMPCCWMGILQKDGRESAVLLLYRTGHIEIRSFPNLEVVGESSLLSLLRWNFKPNMETTVCSDDFGHIVLMRLLKRELLYVAVTITYESNKLMRPLDVYQLHGDLVNLFLECNVLKMSI